MSDVQKPVEETPVVIPAAETAVEVPATTEATEAPKETTEVAPVEETATDKPAETEAPKEEAKEEAKEEVKPASEGILGHKAPGLVKSLRFAKRFFYFNDEPVEAKQLSVFHQNEKPAVANPTAAWASQTGKGLLFLTKRAEDKATPAGIFNLAEISDLTKEGSNEFLFKVAGQKHTFQASNATERDSWFVALEAKSAEAKAEKETLTSSEGYKAELEKLTKPAVVVAAKKPEEKKEEAPATEEAKTEEAEPKEEKPKETAKSRSQSRKRGSIFGAILGKKETEEKKAEEPKEETAEETKAAEPATEAAIETPAETIAEPAAEPAATEAPIEAEVVAAPVEATEKKEEKKAKRASIFGNFFNKVTSPSQEKSEKEATAPVEETPVASSAPQLDNPVEEAAAPIEAEAVIAPAEAEAAKETTAETPLETPKDKRRSSFFGFKKEKKADTSDNEATTDGEKEAKKANKLGGLFRKPSKAVKLDKEGVAAAETEVKPEQTEASTEVAAETVVPVEEATKATETATAEEPKNVEVPTSTPVQAAA
ncbi:uncharacterized protein N7503_002334 [Penicillium pulvis]|uniref:uncharacterized protein n=1 Tax=Penicillium pulvis TaxID=1562058 RepID=UPI002547C333|nr:uncharacterized protein N7503_002334 [Penicillium pulvis]KAJ5810116.1 hypothetical protein N7503_002334 [Penicillium pulvis]